MYTVKLTDEQHKLIVHALRVVSHLTTGLTDSDREAASELLRDVQSLYSDETPEWQRKK